VISADLESPLQRFAANERLKLTLSGVSGRKFVLDQNEWPRKKSFHNEPNNQYRVHAPARRQTGAGNIAP
jgi:hypothetical protein